MTERNTAYEFVPVVFEDVLRDVISIMEGFLGITVQPGSALMLLCTVFSTIIVNERAMLNVAGNQNVPSGADGENLDRLGEQLYMLARPEAKGATCMMEFKISAAQQSAILIPGGTRVTDSSKTLYWETQEDVFISPGETTATAQVVCQTIGTAGNGYEPGQINSLVDIFPYYTSCRNTTKSDGGSDVPTDDEYYDLLRRSTDAKSTAGPVGGYEYWARTASSEIADVLATSPEPGTVTIYTLMKDGKPAGEEVKKAVLEACNADNVRPMTDLVQTGDPETVKYDIDLTYYIPRSSTESAASIQAQVEKAVDEYVAWQCAKLGRDINPSELYGRLMQTGIKRIVLRKPEFKELKDGSVAVLEVRPEDTIPQLAELESRTVKNGGYEGE